MLAKDSWMLDIEMRCPHLFWPHVVVRPFELLRFIYATPPHRRASRFAPRDGGCSIQSDSRSQRLGEQVEKAKVK